MAFSTEVAVAEARAMPRRRQHPRVTLRSLAYIKLDQGNGGIIRDLTECGVAIQAIAPLSVRQELKVRFDLFSPRVRIDARGRVVWADGNGQGGIEFLELPPRMQRALRDWLFSQIFSAAANSGRDLIFADYGPQLMLSAARPAIVVEPEPAASGTQLHPAARLEWGLLRLSARTLSIFVDSVILVCAVLLFSIISLAIMGGLPAWPLTAALSITASTIFIAVYQLLFSDLLCGASPGRRLAALATAQPLEREILPRFR